MKDQDDSDAAPHMVVGLRSVPTTTIVEADALSHAGIYTSCYGIVFIIINITITNYFIYSSHAGAEEKQ